MLNELMQRHAAEVTELFDAFMNTTLITVAVIAVISLIIAIIVGSSSDSEIVGSMIFMLGLAIATVTVCALAINNMQTIQDTREASGEELKAVLTDEYSLTVDNSETALENLLLQGEVTAKNSDDEVIKISIESYNDEYHVFSDGTKLEPVL